MLQKYFACLLIVIRYFLVMIHLIDIQSSWTVGVKFCLRLKAIIKQELYILFFIAQHMENFKRNICGYFY